MTNEGKDDAIEALDLLMQRVARADQAELVELSQDADVGRIEREGAVYSYPESYLISLSVRVSADPRLRAEAEAKAFGGGNSLLNRDCQLYTGKCSCPDGEPRCAPG